MEKQSEIGDYQIELIRGRKFGLSHNKFDLSSKLKHPPGRMEDNYYKRGKEHAMQAQGRQPAATRSRAKTATAKVQSAAKTNTDHGQGRVVESSQAGFGHVQHNSWKSLVPTTGDVQPASSGSAVKLQNQDMSANSNGQRRVRHSTDHFATLHQTPQQPITIGLSGSSTPLTHLVQKRQFELTTVPKSQSAVSNDCAESYTNQMLHQHHLNNPAITTTHNTASSHKKMASSQNQAGLKAEGFGENHLSTFAQSNLVHSRKVSHGNPSHPKPVLNQAIKPGQGVSSGKLNLNLMQNNFMVASESPQFSLGGPITLKHAESQQTEGGFAIRPEQVKNQPTVAPAGQNQNFGGPVSGALVINAQGSAPANTAAASASQFNTPSNCYQAVNINYTRDSLPKNETTTEANHISSNSYEMTAPLHSHTPGPSVQRQTNSAGYNPLFQHQHSNSTLIANLAGQGQNVSSLNQGNHSQVNFTQQTQQAHPNLQAAQQQMNNNNQNPHLSASQFDISALLRQNPTQQTIQPVLDFQDLCSSQHHTTHPNQNHALKVSMDATTRDIDYLRNRFYTEYGCDTNDILTLFSFWQSNFQLAGPGGMVSGQAGNQSLNLRQQKHHHTITGGTKSNNVTSFGTKSRVNQQQTTLLNFNSQSFDNNTMTTSQIQPRRVARLIDVGGNETEIQHFTNGSVGLTPFDVNQQMIFLAQNHQQPDVQNSRGRRTQPCVRQSSTSQNRQNQTDGVSFHRDVPTALGRNDPIGIVEAEDEKNDFSFEEPAIEVTHSQSAEEEEKSEKSLINALDFNKKKEAPLPQAEMAPNAEWATAKAGPGPSLPKVQMKPISRDQCGFTIQLSPINRFEPSPRRKHGFDFCAFKYGNSILKDGIVDAKQRIKAKGFNTKDKKFLQRHVQNWSKTLKDLYRSQLPTQNSVYKIQRCFNLLLQRNGYPLVSHAMFKRLIPNYASIDSDEHQRPATNRRRDKSLRDKRGTSKSRKRQGSRQSRRDSRKPRSKSLYRDSMSSVEDLSTNGQMPVRDGMMINVTKPVAQVVADAETTQDIQKLCQEIEACEKVFNDEIKNDQDQFDQQVTRQVSQAERALLESRRESQRNRESSTRHPRAGNNTQMNNRLDFKAQSFSSLNAAMPALRLREQPLSSENRQHQQHGMPTTPNQQAHDPKLNTERPHFSGLDMARHQSTGLQKRVSLQEQYRNDLGQEGDISDRARQTQSNALKGKKINVVSHLLDQRSEPCLMKPKKLNLEQQKVKLIALKSKGAPTKQDRGDGESVDDFNRTPNERKYQATQSTANIIPSTNSNSRRKLTLLKTKNINFNSISKLSGRILPSQSASAANANGIWKIKIRDTGDSTERSGTGFSQLNSAAQTVCQSALATHKNTASVTKHKDEVTPDRITPAIKYASARIKLLRVESGHVPTGSQVGHEPSSPASSTSTLGGFSHMRRLVEMLINEFYRKRGESIKVVQRDKQVDCLIVFWKQSLSQQKILGKLKGKAAKTGLVEKEKHLLNYLNGTDTKSLLHLQKDSTTRKYGELAVVEESVLRQALQAYLTKSQ